MMNPIELLKIGEELKGRVSAGVDCEECQEKRSASGYCITCLKVLCDDHDMEHLMRACLSREEKLRRVKAEIERQRAESPDGMTSWDRVDKHLKDFGHLPQGNKTCDICAGAPKPGPAEGGGG